LKGDIDFVVGSDGEFGERWHAWLELKENGKYTGYESTDETPIKCLNGLDDNCNGVPDNQETKCAKSIIFRSTFDNSGYDADFCGGDCGTVADEGLAKTTGNGGVSTAGEGVIIDNSGPDQLSYSVPNNFPLDKGTMTFWVRSKDVTTNIWADANDRVLFSERAGDAGNSFTVIKESNRKLYFKICDSVGQCSLYANYPQSSNLDWDANRWYFIAATWTNHNSGGDKEVKLYINITQEDFKTGTIWPSELGTNMTFGMMYDPVNGLPYRNANVIIDDIRIFNDVLDSSEISDIYESGFDVSEHCPGIVGNLDGDSCIVEYADRYLLQNMINGTGTKTACGDINYDHFIDLNDLTAFNAGAAGPLHCNDCTAANACVTGNKPYWCNPVTLLPEKKCQTCGCPVGYTCLANGVCTVGGGSPLFFKPPE